MEAIGINYSVRTHTHCALIMACSRFSLPTFGPMSSSIVQRGVRSWAPSAIIVQVLQCISPHQKQMISRKARMISLTTFLQTQKKQVLINWKASLLLLGGRRYVEINLKVVTEAAAALLLDQLWYFCYTALPAMWTFEMLLPWVFHNNPQTYQYLPCVGKRR